MWAGRIVPEKGPDLAILAAREAGLPLDTLLRGIAFEVPRSELAATLGLAPALEGDVEWAVSLPTRAACRRVASQIMSAALKPHPKRKVLPAGKSAG